MSASGPTLGHLLGSWTLDPGLIAAFAAAAALYAVGTTRRRGWPARRTASFMAGLATLALALLSGIDGFSERLLSVHMVQHLLLGLVAPALLLWGAPARLALGSTRGRARTALAAALASPASRTLGRPAAAFALFATVVLATHLTGLYELALEHPFVHELEHAAYFWSGVALLAPLIAADPMPHAPGPIARFAWLMGAMAAMALPGALLTFATSVRYPYYVAPARALGRSALADQHMAGAIMWVGGGVVVFALALALAMRALHEEERRQRRRELQMERSGASELRGTAGVLGA
jgi:cytochrome c oxidase assembly factor CtaG